MSSTPIPPAPPSVATHVVARVVLRGIAGSPGIVVGRAVVVGDVRASYTRKYIRSHEIDSEIERFDRAVAHAQEELRKTEREVGATGAAPALMLDAYLLMLEDATLRAKTIEKIRDERKCAEWAVAAACDEIVGAFLVGHRDPYLLERRHDIELVGQRLLRSLMGDPPLVANLSEPSVVVARDLSPADTAAMGKHTVVGIVTEVGSRTSHTSIVARAMGIPSVVGAENAVASINSGDLLVVDGLRGEVTVHPDVSTVADAERRQARHVTTVRGLGQGSDLPCVTACGERILLKANVELAGEASTAASLGADGIGLYRTEFLFLDRTSLPTEDEQFEAYRGALAALAPRPVVLRTFDLGGDKLALSLRTPSEMNPALGVRAVRLALQHPEVFKTQLRAMVRASVHGNLRIMVPMVGNVDELRHTKRLLAEAMEELRHRGLPRADDIPVGMMIEVPSAAILADVFVQDAAFFSIGTNDLVQYALAVDRTNQHVARMASPFHPAVVRLIAGVARVALQHAIPLAACGAMASDPLAASLLVGLGLRELSMAPGAIPEIKEALRRVTVSECEALAQAALDAATAEEVEALVAKALAPRFFDILCADEVGSGEHTSLGT
jgi:phosphotransferase system enzyme I (PtsI)